MANLNTNHTSSLLRHCKRAFGILALTALSYTSAFAQTAFNFSMKSPSGSTQYLTGTLSTANTISGTTGSFEKLTVTAYMPSKNGTLTSYTQEITLGSGSNTVTYDSATGAYYVSAMAINFSVGGTTYYGWSKPSGNAQSASIFQFGTTNGAGTQTQGNIGSNLKMFAVDNGTVTKSIYFSATGTATVPEIDGSRLPQALLIIAGALMAINQLRRKTSTASTQPQQLSLAA